MSNPVWSIHQTEAIAILLLTRFIHLFWIRYNNLDSIQWNLFKKKKKKKKILCNKKWWCRCLFSQNSFFSRWKIYSAFIMMMMMNRFFIKSSRISFFWSKFFNYFCCLLYWSENFFVCFCFCFSQIKVIVYCKNEMKMKINTIDPK